MKILRPNRTNDPTSRQRMHLEVTSLTVLAEAGADVPRVLDSNTGSFADADVELYFVMDRIDGSTLAKYIEKHGSMSLTEAIALVSSLCLTLDAAFERHLGHRDIKPENIILRNHDVTAPVMVDFGLTFNAEVVDVTQLEEGFDNQFLSLPERRTPGEDRRDPRSDITGAVAVLYYCLTARAPHVLRDSNDRPPHRRPDGGLLATTGSERQVRLLNALFDRAFSQELAMRVQSLEELRRRLSEISSDAPSADHESLEAVAARSHAMLVSTDRTTKLSLYRNEAKNLKQRFQAAVSRVDAKLKAYPRFTRTAEGRHFNLPEPPCGGDVLSQGIIISVQVQGHAIKYSVSYALHAVGDEAVISRIVVREGKPDTGIFRRVPKPDDINIICEWQVIDRYPANLPPPEGHIENDFERQMTIMIERLCSEIVNAPSDA